MKNKKVIVIVVLAIALTGGISAYWFANRSSDTANNDDINYVEATKDEKAETESNKEEVAKQTEQANKADTSPSASSKKAVQPVISFWGQDGPGQPLEVNGYVPGIIEKGGKCTLVLIKGNSRILESRTSLENAQDTSCGLFIVPKAKLANGSWSIQLKYDSSKAAGTSDKVSVEVK